MTLEVETKQFRTFPLIITFCIIGIIFFVANEVTAPHDEQALVVSIVIIGTLFVVGVYGLKLSVEYSGLKIVSTSFLFLGLAFIAYGVSETLWVHNDWFGLPTYPNLVIDGLNSFHFIFAIMHILFTVKHYDLSRRNRPDLMLSILVFTSLVFGAYTICANAAEVDAFDYYYALPFVLAAGSLAGMTFFTLRGLIQTNIAKAWLLLGFSIMLSSCAHIYFYIIADMYSYGNIVDTIFFMSHVVMLAGMMLYRKLI
jgi:hypothetical protein